MANPQALLEASCSGREYVKVQASESAHPTGIGIHCVLIECVTLEMRHMEERRRNIDAEAADVRDEGRCRALAGPSRMHLVDL